MKLIKIEMLLMDNNELLFYGKSLGFIGKKEEEAILEEKGAEAGSEWKPYKSEL